MPKFAKGSPEMKAHMAKLRAMRGKGMSGCGVSRQKMSPEMVEKFAGLHAGAHVQPMDGHGLKEMFQNSKLGKAVSKFGKRHKGVIKALREDPSVLDLYHHHKVAPFHKDIEAVANHFGEGLYGGGGLGGGVVIHHHHHHHGEGIGDFFRDLGHKIEDKVIHPAEHFVQDKVVPFAKNKVVPFVQNKVVPVAKEAGRYITKRKGGLASDLVHYGIPAFTSTLGSATGAALGGLATGGAGGEFVGGVAGSALGSKAGDYLANKIGNATGTGLRRRRR
jgi:hypothetical protein